MYIALLDRVLFSLVLVCNQLLSNNNIYRFVVKRIDATVGGGRAVRRSDGDPECNHIVHVVVIYQTNTIMFAR